MSVHDNFIILFVSDLVLGHMYVNEEKVFKLSWFSSDCDCVCLYTYWCHEAPALAVRAFRCWGNANNKEIRLRLCPCICECLISIQEALPAAGCRNIYCVPNLWFILINTSNRLIYLFAFNLKEKELWSYFFKITSGHCPRKIPHRCLLKWVKR